MQPTFLANLALNLAPQGLGLATAVKASDAVVEAQMPLFRLAAAVPGLAPLALAVNPLFRPANDNGADSRAQKLKANLDLLADLDPETDDPLERQTNRVMNAVSIERLEGEVASALADKDVLSSLAEGASRSGEQEVAKQAPLFKAFAALYDKDPEEAEKELKKLGDDFPEAKAIAEQLENQRRRAVNESALETWDNFIEEGLAASLGAKNSAVGLALDFIPWIAGEGNGIDRTHARWNTQKDLLAAVRKKIRQEDGLTLKQALTDLSLEGGPLQAAAKNLLGESHNRGWGPGYRTNAVGFLVGYTEALDNGDTKQAKELAHHLYENADHLTVMDGAGKSAYGLYALLQATSDDKKLQADCASKMKELETGDKSIASLVWDEIRTTGTDTVASLVLTAGAVRLGKLAQAGSLVKLHKMGVTGHKALLLSYGAGFGVETHALFVGNTLYQAATNDVSKVLTLDQMKKGYVMNLISLGLMKGFGIGGGVLGKNSSPVRKFVLKHGFSLGGSITGSHVNLALKLTPKPKGGTKETLVKDVFGYVKYSAASKVAGKLPLPVRHQHAPEPVFPLMRRIQTQAVFPLVRKKQPAFAKRGPVNEADPFKNLKMDESTKAAKEGTPNDGNKRADSNKDRTNVLLRALSFLEVKGNRRLDSNPAEPLSFKTIRKGQDVVEVQVKVSGAKQRQQVIDALKDKGLEVRVDVRKDAVVQVKTGKAVTVKFTEGKGKAPAPAPAPLLPKGALFSVGSPAAGLYAFLTAHGVQPGTAAVISGVSMVLPLVGMSWLGGRGGKKGDVPPVDKTLASPVGARPKPEKPVNVRVQERPQVLTPSAHGGPVSYGRNILIMKSQDGRGHILVHGPMGEPAPAQDLWVNGAKMEKKWMPIQEGAVIREGHKTYVFHPQVPKQAPAAFAKRDVPSADQDFLANDRSPLRAIEMARPDGSRVLVAIRGTGAAGVKSEVAQSASQGIQTDLKFGKTLGAAVGAAKHRVLQRVHIGNIKDLPEVQVGAVEIRPSPDGSLVASNAAGNELPAVILRPGDVPKTLLPSMPQNVRKGDVVVVGQFGVSGGVLQHLMVTRGARTAGEVRDLIHTESKIRARLAETGSGKVLNDKAYAEAYREVTGHEMPAHFPRPYQAQRNAAGQYISYEIGPDGTVFETAVGASGAKASRPVDKFERNHVAAAVHVVE